jgi:hypothetical protein
MQQKHEENGHDHDSNVAGKNVGEWTADQDLGSDGPNDKGAATHAIKNVLLSSGSIIRISGRPEAGEHARLDYVEITPSGTNSAPLKFEAEYMKLSHYQVEKVTAASGNKVVRAERRTGVAELQFPGATGNYDLSVHYFDENDGKSSFTVQLEEPAAETKE